MFKFQKKSLSTALLLLALPLAGCAADNMFADDSIKPYGGSKLHPIKVVNGKAVVENCGDWSENRADTTENDISASHGCAVQSNIAAMAAYPSDLAGNTRKRPKRLGWIHQYAIDKVTADPSTSGSSPSSTSPVPGGTTAP
jgi:hypothetical protein